ncbi:hypothetical protein [Priestia megaterium]|uniref:hypothetical protein n=1 Tax=Priestia megaterium TaxID=1404 RepID=UPI001C99C152|nr:hypothetical protein [Priestia megaterium]
MFVRVIRMFRVIMGIMGGFVIWIIRRVVRVVRRRRIIVIVVGRRRCRGTCRRRTKEIGRRDSFGLVRLG